MMIEEILKAYLTVLKIHIGTKTKDIVFHEFTADVYNELFNVFHMISEKLEDIDDGKYTINDVSSAKKEVYKIIGQVKDIVDNMKDEYSTGMDNLVRGLADKLETLNGTAKGFTK